jgi:hypothetical protein
MLPTTLLSMFLAPATGDLLAPAPGDTDLAVRVALPADELVSGGTYELVVTLDPTPPLDPEHEGERGYDVFPEDEFGPLAVRRPILQLDVPAGVELLGGEQTVLEEPYDFERFYQRQPYGRVATHFEERFRFRLTAEPSEGARIGVNVVAYTGHAGVDSPERSGFLRLRADVPLRAGAEVRATPSRQSAWGTRTTLAIGDRAPDFDWPELGGERARLADTLGEKWVLVSTYRGTT